MILILVIVILALNLIQKHYKLILLFDFVIIMVDKVEISIMVDLGMISRITINITARLINDFAWLVCYDFGKT